MVNGNVSPGWKMYTINACGVNPIDGHMYCYIRMIDPVLYRDAFFLARIAKDGVHLVYRITDIGENNGMPIGTPNNTRAKIYSATITPEGDYVVFRQGHVGSDDSVNHAGSCTASRPTPSLRHN